MILLGEPPQRIQAQVWSRMPEQFRAHAKPTDWANANKHGQILDSFLEGPVFDAQGNLYVTDIPHGRIFRISPDKQWDLLIQYDGEPNGMKWLGDGVLLIADYRNGLMQFDIARGQISAFLSRRDSEGFKGVNDLTFDSRGNLYFTDQGQTGLHDPTGRVYRLAPDGQLSILLDNVPSPNGLVLTPDERVLFVAATRGNEIWRTPVLPNGTVSKVGRFFTSHGPMGPDGLAMDSGGHLFIANPGLGCIWRINDMGEPTHIWTSPTGRGTTNLAFSALAPDQVFVTESDSGTILTFTAPQDGARVNAAI